MWQSAKFYFTSVNFEASDSPASSSLMDLGLGMSADCVRYLLILLAKSLEARTNAPLCPMKIKVG